MMDVGQLIFLDKYFAFCVNNKLIIL